MNKKRVVLAVIILLALAIAGYIFVSQKDDTPNSSDVQSPQSSTQQTAETQGFDKTMHPLDEPGSPWWVVNKTRPLPDGYVPPDLIVPNVKLRLAASAEQMQFSKSAQTELEEMFTAATADGVTLVFGSGFRSEAYQTTLYTGYVATDGQAAADRYSARPGTSEHQTGLSFDATASNGACHLERCFKDTPEGKWLAANSYRYGFIIRYPDGKEPITGYEYEPWHMRYVGKELALEMHNQRILTLEEFFGLPAAPDYQ